MSRGNPTKTIRAGTWNGAGFAFFKKTKDPGIIAQAEAKAVKVTASLHRFLPPGHDYKVVFLRRPLPEITASQGAMLARQAQRVRRDPRARHSTAALISHRINDIENDFLAIPSIL